MSVLAAPTEKDLAKIEAQIKQAKQQQAESQRKSQALDKEVKNVQKRENIKYDLCPDKNYGFNGIEKGGSETTGFDGIWDWMSNQKKENK